MRPALPKFTMTQRFMLGIIPAALSGIILLGVSAFYVTRHHVTKSIKKDIQVFSESAASSVASFFSQRKNDVEVLSQTPLFADYYNNADYGLSEEAEQYRKELGKYFLGFSRRAGVYLSVVYADEKGREICRIQNDNISPPLAKYPEPDIFSATSAFRKKEVLRFPVSQSRDSGPRAVHAKAIFDGTGSFRGIIAMETGLKPLEASLARLTEGTGGIFVSDASGRVVLSGREERAEGYDFSARSSVFGTDLTVTVTARLSDFQAPLIIIKHFTLFFAVLFCFISGFLIYIAIHRLTKPLKELVKATNRFADGNFDERVEIKRDDEIGALALSFNMMAGRIMKHSKEMEARITELLFLQEMSAEVVRNLNEDNICEVCLRAAVSGLGFDRGVIYLVNREGTHLIGRDIHSPHQQKNTRETIRRRKVPLDGTDILAEVVRQKKPVRVENPELDPRVNKAFIAEVETTSFCLVPIMTEQKVLGVIGVDNRYSERKITAEHIDNLMLFGNFTALALENAGLVADVRLSRERYKAVLDNSPEAIIGLDPFFRVSVWNRGAHKLFGYSEEEMRGKPASRLFDPLVFETIMRETRKTGFFSSPSVEGINSRNEKFEIEIIWAGSSVVPCENREWTVVIRDTSERRKMQARLIQAEKLSAVGRLISGVVHELSNPLSVILGFSEMYGKSGRDPVEIPAEDLALVYESSIRCGDMVKNLLSFVRESGKKKEIFSVPQVIETAVSLIGYKMSKADNIFLEKDIQAYLPPVIGDSREIEQVLVNLMQNACDALAGRPGEKKIKLAARLKGGAIFISVADNGPGVKTENLGLIFEPFFTTKPEGEGTGLGLYICRNIAERHGGSLSCGGSPGGGAVFTLELPIAGKPCENCPSSEFRKITLPAGKRILVVDDEENVLKMVKKMLETEGQKVHVAVSVSDAVEKLKNETYDAVICDVEMGPEKGFSVREALIEKNTSTEFVFTTGNVLNPVLVNKLRELKVPFISKPFNRTELLAVMGEVLLRR